MHLLRRRSLLAIGELCTDPSSFKLFICSKFNCLDEYFLSCSQYDSGIYTHSMWRKSRPQYDIEYQHIVNYSKRELYSNSSFIFSTPGDGDLARNFNSVLPWAERSSARRAAPRSTSATPDHLRRRRWTPGCGRPRRRVGATSRTGPGPSGTWPA